MSSRKLDCSPMDSNDAESRPNPSPLKEAQMNTQFMRSMRKEISSSDDDSSEAESEEEDPCKRPRTLSDRWGEKSSHPQVFLDACKDNDLQSHSVISNGNGPESSNTSVPKRKKNNVWGSVMQDQDLEQGLQQNISIHEKDPVCAERGVEGYDFKKAKDDKREFAVAPLIAESPDDLFQNADVINEPYSKILEEEGLKPKAEIQGQPIEKVKETNDETEVEPEQKRASRKRTHDQSRGRRFTPTPREPSRQYDKTATCDETDDEERVVYVIQNRLQEARQNVISQVVATLGKQKALQLLEKTELVQSGGGIMTFDNRRQRTIGGVFMYLIKISESISKEEKKLIFQVPEEIQNKRKKKLAQRRREKKKKETTSEAMTDPTAEMDKSDETSISEQKQPQPHDNQSEDLFSGSMMQEEIDNEFM